MEKNINKGLREDEIKKLKKFGYSFSLGMAILFAISTWKNFVLPFRVIVSILFAYHLFGAFFCYKFLYPTYVLTSFIGKIIGNLFTVVIFTVVFYLLFTPISIILRLFKKDVIKNNSVSPQWIMIPDKQNDPKRVERMF
ncbi:MAG: hypothetical protein GX066_09225 [Clostridiaceae bacterium]|nr:hypothetical protein [Clostridiaceae bacterium]